MTTPAAVAEPIQPPYTVDSPQGREVLRGLFAAAWRVLPDDVLQRCCAAITAEDDEAAAGPSPRR